MTEIRTVDFMVTSGFTDTEHKYSHTRDSTMLLASVTGRTGNDRGHILLRGRVRETAGDI